VEIRARVMNASRIVTVVVVVLATIAWTSWHSQTTGATYPVEPSPALPFDTATACVHLNSQTLELSPESKRTLASFLEVLSPAAQKAQWVGVTLSRTVVGTNLEEPPFLSGPEGVYFTTSRKDALGRLHSTQGRLYDEVTTRILMRKILSPELAGVQTVSFSENHSTDPADCELEVMAHALIGPPPPTFRIYDCTPDGCKQRTNK
jgi:hypothetical protein